MSTRNSRQGAVAAGHPKTAQAAIDILHAGGNAFDAVMAAMAVACVAEPVLCSLGGGGFLLARPKDGTPRLLDFFVQTPISPVDTKAVDFQPILCDFGTVQQEFHVGRGSIGTPGCVKGLFHVAQNLGRMPVRAVLEPAMQVAREGVRLNRLQAYIFDVVGPIYMITPESRAIFESRERPGLLVGEGERVANPDYADFLEVLAIEGEDLYYRGEFSAAVDADCRANGGTLSRADFEAYELIPRDPLALDYGGVRLLTNPPPSTGGILIAFALQLFAHARGHGWTFGDLAHLQTLVRVMKLTNEARMESGLHEATSSAEERLFDPGFLERYRAEVVGRPKAYRGTTHISVIDDAGNAAALTLSNGEGCGHVVPGTGVMLNNMLGEEDLNPAGFHAWTPDSRMSSMMAPTLIEDSAGCLTALGSGGANRIRTAILQVLINLIDFAMPLAEAVEAPRAHYEQGMLNLEPGFTESIVSALEAEWPNVKAWHERNLFFGGVHAVQADYSDGRMEGAGDPRRGGVALIL